MAQASTATLRAAKDRNQLAKDMIAFTTQIADPDPDIRFMQLYELEANLRLNVAEYLRADYNSIARIIDGLVKALTDTNGEVQNQAVKWYFFVRIPMELN